MRTWLILLLVRTWCYVRHPRLVSRFTTRIRRLPDPAFPTRVHDKYLWRKIFDHNPLFTRVSDKLLAKEFARERCDDIRVARVLWEGDDPARIPDAALAGDVVVKANHGCRWNHFVRDEPLDREELEQKARTWLESRWGRAHGEWGYRGVEPRLFVEERLRSKDGTGPNEYNCNVASGRVAYLYTLQRRPDGRVTKSILDRDGKAYETSMAVLPRTALIEAPPHLDRIVAAAERIGAPFDAIRCDIYEVDGELYLSELTVYSLGGYDWVGEASLMDRLNELWDIRRSWFLTTPQRGWRRIYADALRTRSAQMKRSISTSST